MNTHLNIHPHVPPFILPLTVTLAEGDAEGVCDPLGVPEGVREPDGVLAAVPDGEGVALLLGVTVTVADWEPVSEGDADPLAVLEPDGEVEGDPLSEGEEEAGGDGTKEGVPAVGDALLLPLVLPVTCGGGGRNRGVKISARPFSNHCSLFRVHERAHPSLLTVLLRVMEDVALPVTAAVALPVGVPLPEEVMLLGGEPDTLMEADAVLDGVPLRLGVREGVADQEGVEAGVQGCRGASREPEGPPSAERKAGGTLDGTVAVEGATVVKHLRGSGEMRGGEGAANIWSMSVMEGTASQWPLGVARRKAQRLPFCSGTTHSCNNAITGSAILPSTGHSLSTSSPLHSTTTAPHLLFLHGASPRRAPP